LRPAEVLHPAREVFRFNHRIAEALDTLAAAVARSACAPIKNPSCLE
jgi:hypothetical protein